MMTRIRILICALAFISLCASLSAQAYSIRVTYNTNLRASHSLQAAVMASARAGATVQVTGSHEKWLKIDWNGRTLWMANWVPYDQVESQLPADVDNCCFIDRECRTDREWVSGYWAFQRNECGAPATSSSSTAAQPISGPSPENVDNCCYLGWQCNNDQDWTNGFYAFRENRCKHRGLAIHGSAAFVTRVEAALDMLMTRTPNWYNYVVDGLSRVREVPESEGAGVYVGSGLFSITPSHAYLDARWGVPVEQAVMWVASILVHDACHVHLYRAGKTHGGLEGERACLTIQIQANNELDPSLRYTFGLPTVLENIDNPEYQWWH